MKISASWPVVVAEDSRPDFLLLQAAWSRAGNVNVLECVPDGTALLERLRFPGRRAALVLMDLNMPRKNGLEALAEMKADSGLAAIPVIIFSTSRDDEALRRAYDLGASSYVVKPFGLPELVEAVKIMRSYWLGLVEVPQ
jgi:CheY-like chemotaxis protein